MAQSPKNIMLRLGYNLANSNRNTATMPIIRRWFYNAGYGKSKVDKWIDLYTELGIIYATDDRDENGDRLYSCEWWMGKQVVV